MSRFNFFIQGDIRQLAWLPEGLYWVDYVLGHQGSVGFRTTQAWNDPIATTKQLSGLFEYAGGRSGCESGKLYLMRPAVPLTVKHLGLPKVEEIIGQNPYQPYGL